MRTLISKPFCLGLVAFSLALAPMVARAAENPVAEPKVSTVRELPFMEPGQQSYVLVIGKTKKVVKATKIKIVQPGDSTKPTTLFIDGIKQVVMGTVGVAVATGSGASANYSSSTNSTITPLPGGGTRIDTTNGDGSTVTTIYDPAGGKNGGSRTTTSTTDTEGNTTTVTTTTDGSDGTSTTTVTTSP